MFLKHGMSGTEEKVQPKSQNIEPAAKPCFAKRKCVPFQNATLYVWQSASPHLPHFLETGILSGWQTLFIKSIMARKKMEIIANVNTFSTFAPLRFNALLSFELAGWIYSVSK